MENEFITHPDKNIGAIKSQLSENGIAFYEHDFTQEEFADFGNKFGELFKHTDSIENSITVVKSIFKKEEDPSKTGLTSSSLFPHTDRACLDAPPNLLMLYCKDQSHSGGDSILVDSREIVEEIIGNANYSDHPLLEKDSVIFDDGKKAYKGSILEVLADKSFFLRFRNDKFAYFSNTIYPFLETFYKNIELKKKQIKLKAGQGYIINNGRFLHGRIKYEGGREMWRLLITDNFLKQKGFNIK